MWKGPAIFSAEQPLDLLRNPGNDGSTVAEITYFGAVNAGCEHTEEAYELLRMFLTPEVQFHQTLSTGTTRLWDDDCAWPVRVTGSVQGKLLASIAHTDAIVEPLYDISAIRSILLTDDDLPLLKDPLDHVRFRTPFTYDFLQTMSELTPENVREKAAKLIVSAKYHIAES